VAAPPARQARRRRFNRWIFESILIFLPLAITIVLFPVVLFSMFLEDQFVLLGLGVFLGVVAVSLLVSSLAALRRIRRDQSH